MRIIEDRARGTYFRRFGSGADMPSVKVDKTAGIVDLYNVNGVLGAYRIASDGTLRWDEDLARRLMPRRERWQEKGLWDRGLNTQEKNQWMG